MKKIKILYEDKDIILVEKPAGLLSISTNNEKEKTMFHQVFMYLKQKNKNNKVFIVHRLDRDTSGIILFAKNEKIKFYLQENWDKLVIKRGYTALVEGHVEKDNGTVKSWLKEGANYISYSSQKPYDGKLAITKYSKMKSNKNYSLLAIEILTGRKNQIRVHMKDINNPVVGDKKYGSVKNPIGRLGLHANYLEFTHPTTKEVLKIESKIPKEFSMVFEKGLN